MTREEVQDLIFGSSNAEEAEAALKAVEAWMSEHPNDTNLQDEASFAWRILDQAGLVQKADPTHMAGDNPGQAGQLRSRHAGERAIRHRGVLP